MAGLLAWAADVVGGNNNGEDGNGDGVEDGEKYIVPKFSREEEDEVRELDEKAGCLQKSLQVLRYRIPPNTPTNTTLPHLHADTLALTLELHAHSATRLQAQLREASLLEENAAYAKAITSGQQQIQEKSHEVHQLEAKLKEVDKFGRKQRIEFEELQNLALERENHGSGNGYKSEGITDSFSSSSAATTMAAELENKRNELKFWEDKLIELEEKWKTLQHNLSCQLSPAQREKELERRLRSLTEQLVTKQAQAEALANEKNALEFRLVEANDARRKLHLENEETNVKRNEVGRSGLTTLTFINARYEESNLHSQVSTIAACPRVIKESGSKLRRAADAFGLITCGYRRFKLLRSLIAAYILGLHIVVFIIISFTKMA